MGRMDVRLLCEMRRFQQEPGKAEARAVCFAVVALCVGMECFWRDRTEKIPRLLCISATTGVDMFSLDVYRLDGKPGASRRGSVTHAVDEDHLRRELYPDADNPVAAHRGTGAPTEDASAAASSQTTTGDLNEAFVLEDDAPL